jgi:HEAT repeat protein
LLQVIEGDADIYQKAAAIAALGRIVDFRAEAALISVVDQGPRILRITALQALAQMRARRQLEFHGGRNPHV